MRGRCSSKFVTSKYITVILGVRGVSNLLATNYTVIYGVYGRGGCF